MKMAPQAMASVGIQMEMVCCRSVWGALVVEKSRGEVEEMVVVLLLLLLLLLLCGPSPASHL